MSQITIQNGLTLSRVPLGAELKVYTEPPESSLDSAPTLLLGALAPTLVEPLHNAIHEGFALLLHLNRDWFAILDYGIDNI